MQKLIYFICLLMTSYARADQMEYFLLDHCQTSIDELSEKLSHLYVEDLCEWYYIYGQMNALEDIHSIIKDSLTE